MMAQKKTGALVVREGNRFKGIISECNYASKLILEGKSLEQRPIKKVASEDIITARPDQSIEECMKVMKDKRIRHLPISQAGQPIGIISTGHVVKGTISEQEFMVALLENYVSGTQ